MPLDTSQPPSAGSRAPTQPAQQQPPPQPTPTPTPPPAGSKPQTPAAPTRAGTAAAARTTARALAMQQMQQQHQQQPGAAAAGQANSLLQAGASGEPGHAQREAAVAYLQRHGIAETLQQILTALLHARPDDPRRFIAKKLEDAKSAKARGQALLVFSRENLVALFRVFDVTGKGHIMLEQYQAAMADIGAHTYNPMPVGHEKDRIMMDDFVDNAFVALIKPKAV